MVSASGGAAVGEPVPGVEAKPDTRKWLHAAWIILAVIFAIFVYRAWTQSVVHDEALSYILFVSQGADVIRHRFSSNNHTLNSLLMLCSVKAFGLSEIALRIPALLGAILYLISIRQLCVRWFSCRTVGISTLLFAALNPFIVDYLVAARGYSLALGFLLAAVCVSDELLFGGPGLLGRAGVTSSNLKCALISLLTATSVASNFAFAFVNTALLATVLFWSISTVFDRSNTKVLLKEIVTKAAFLAIPGACLYLAICPGIFHFNHDTLYFGSASWSETYTSIVAAVFDDFTLQIGSSGEVRLAVLSWLILVLLSISLVNVIAVVARVLSRKNSLTLTANRSFFLFTILLSTIVFHTAAHRWLGALLPEDRTGIFFVPLAAMALGLTAENLHLHEKLKTLAAPLFASGIALCALYFVACLRVTYFREWKYDANSKQVCEMLKYFHGPASEGQVAVNWLFHPSLLFYSRSVHNYPIQLFSNAQFSSAYCVFVLLADKDAEFIKQNHLKTVFIDPVSQEGIFVK